MALITDLAKNFQRLIKRGGLSHGYVLFGQESAEEKRQLAKELAGYLEQKQWAIPKKPLIDALIVDAGIDGGIELARSAKRFLWQTPVVSSKRTLIIDRADALTIPAQNAILKIAEEPPSHALIILLVRNYEILLPALQSRFQKIYAHGNPKFEILNSKQIPNFKQNSKFQIPNSKQNSKFKIPSKDKLKEIIEDDKKLEEFVAGLILELRRDKIRNWRALKELLHRWSLIKQFNVNKKLQLETVLSWIRPLA